jgi:hypothetical protein
MFIKLGSDTGQLGTEVAYQTRCIVVQEAWNEPVRYRAE